MILEFDVSLAKEYKSNSQKARILTEHWVQYNMFCPRCGNQKIDKLENNKAVADFLCPECTNKYELKSKSGGVASEITDGAYQTMIDQIVNRTNPDFFFLTYDMASYSVKNFFVVPRHFFTPQIIKKRKPLAPTARRAGWVGCNILVNSIPEDGRIFVVDNGQVKRSDVVVKKLQKTEFLAETNLDSRGWLLDIMNFINKLKGKEFSISEMYSFESSLYNLHPKNNNIQAKIRQQLQILRDKNYIEFLGNGKYRKQGDE